MLGSLWRRTSRAALERAEHALLSRMKRPGCRPSAEDDCSQRFSRRLVDLGAGRRINTVIVGDVEQPPVVLLHGYGAGVGFWYKNLPALALHNRVYAIDLLGFGRSSRPEFDFASDDGELDEDALDRAEEFFTGSLEDWRHAVGLDKPFVLLGHSFGGYVATLYALKHSDRLQSLILASPFGVPDEPLEHDDSIVSGETGEAPRAPRQQQQQQQQHSHHHPEPSQVSGKLNSANTTHQTGTAPQQQSPSKKKKAEKLKSGDPKSHTSHWVERMWANNVTPPAAVRALGPLSSSLMSYVVHRRFARLDEDERDDLAEYTHHLWAQQGSAEFALTTLFKPFGWAKRPLANFLGDLQVPTYFVYGEYDWMDSSVPMRAWHNKINPNIQSVQTLPECGHQVTNTKTLVHQCASLLRCSGQ
eukprot:TRINITY_DN66336_c7_g5_i2.p1 TRINITY_DN66336_c7_g5~~TRINITY_DN66336_c7_g5_i2.p1  ORF type:complete len:416 (-),score=162.41 TRINITY_DN66336_c7_g5_i2:20-1267(-)